MTSQSRIPTRLSRCEPANQFTSRVAVLIVLALLVMALNGCVALSASLFRSDVEISGDGVVKNDGKYVVHVDQEGIVSWVTQCDSWKQNGWMVFPVIPMPPLLPIGDGAALNTRDKAFVISINSNNGQRQDAQALNVVLIIDGIEHKLVREYETYYGLENTLWRYKFVWDHTCGEVVNAELRIENVLVHGVKQPTLKYRLDYREGTVWEWRYFGA